MILEWSTWFMCQVQGHIRAQNHWKMIIYVGLVGCMDVYWSDFGWNQYSTSKIKWNKLSQVNVYRPGLHCKSLIYLRSSDPTRIISGFLKQNTYQRKVVWNYSYHSNRDVQTPHWSSWAIKEQTWLKASVEKIWLYIDVFYDLVFDKVSFKPWVKNLSSDIKFGDKTTVPTKPKAITRKQVTKSNPKRATAKVIAASRRERSTPKRVSPEIDDERVYDVDRKIPTDALRDPEEISSDESSAEKKFRGWRSCHLVYHRQFHWSNIISHSCVLLLLYDS